MSDETGEKTEDPTPKKLRTAREEGQVAHSKDLTHTVLFLALFGYMLADAEEVIRRLGQMMIVPAGMLHMSFGDAVNALLEQMLRDLIRVVGPYVLIVIVLGILAEALQTGFLISFKAATPSGKKLNIVTNIKNIFARKNLFEFLKSNIKIAVLSVVIWVVLSDELGVLMTLPQAGIIGVGVAVGLLLKSLTIKIAVAYFIIAAADYAWQRHDHHREQMMTKDEVKREFKENEGDPHIKHERKNIHQEMLQEGAVERTRSASVVVTNPTHLAIAILYESDRTPLPVVIAKGEGALANRMMQAARESGVPVMQNIPLARALMSTAQVDQYIPEELIQPMAEVLRVVREMKE